MFRQIGLGQALDAGRIPQDVLDWYVALLRHTDTMRNEFGLARWVEQFVLLDSVLSRIRAPTYFLWGEEDPFAGADIASQFVGRIPNAELALLPDAGHAVWLDDLEFAVNVTTGFLGD